MNMKITIELDERLLRNMVEDFQTGFISNPSARADNRRMKYEIALVNALLQTDERKECHDHQA